MNFVLLLKLKIILERKKKEKTLKTLIIVSAGFPSASIVWQGEDAWCVGIFVLVLGCLVDCFSPKYFPLEELSSAG